MSFWDAFSNAKSITNFLRGEEITVLVGDIGLSAAKGCLIDFRSVTSESSKRDLINSAINHLEHADESYKQAIRKGGNILFRTSKLETVKMMRIFLWANIAICEKYLGNYERMNIALNRAKEINKNGASHFSDKMGDWAGDKNVGKTIVGILGISAHSIISLWNPFFYIDSFKHDSLEDKYSIDMEKLEKELSSKII